MRSFLYRDFWTGSFGAVVLAILTVLVTFYLNDLFDPTHWYYLTDSDQARSALVAKSLANGWGYKTPLLTNAMVDFYAQMGKLSPEGLWENSDRFPMTIFGIFVFFKLFGITSPFVAMALFGAVFFTALVYAAYYMTFQLTANRLISLLSAVLICTNPDLTVTIFYKGADDAFYGLLLFTLYITWRKKIYQELTWRAPVLGAAIGLAFLCRQNMGAFFALGIAIDALQGLVRKELRWGNVILAGMLVLLACIAVIAPWGIYTSKVWGRPFFSSNGLYQFSFYTPYQMDTDPWWKLHTPVGQIANAALFQANPWPWINNIGKFIQLNITGMVTDHYGELLAIAYLWAFHRKDRDFANIKPVLLITAIAFILSLLMLGPWIEAAYSPTYYIFILPILRIILAFAIMKLLQRLGSFFAHIQTEFHNVWVEASSNRPAQESDHPSFLTPYLSLAKHAYAKLFQVAEANVGMAFIVWTALIGMMTIISHNGIAILTHINGAGLGALLFKGLVSIFFITGLLYICVFGQILLKHRTRILQAIPRAFLILVLASICMVLPQTAQRGIKANNYLVLPKPSPALSKLKEITDKNSIVLSFNGFYGIPWLTGLRALALPEYPDYIYELILKYGLPIDAILLDDSTDWFYTGPFKWAPSYVMYPVLEKTRGIIPGFELVDYRIETQEYSLYKKFPQLHRTMALYRRIPGFNFASVTQPPQAYEAGNLKDRIHFVSGFGETGTIDGKKVIFGSDEVRTRFARRPQSLAPWTDHDITFFATENKKPKSILINAYIPDANQISAYLNLDVDTYDPPVIRATKQVADYYAEGGQWVTFKIDLPTGTLRNGFNKIGLRAATFHKIRLGKTAINAMQKESETPLQEIGVTSNGELSENTEAATNSPQNTFIPDGSALPMGLMNRHRSDDPCWEDIASKNYTDGELQPQGSLFIHEVRFIYENTP